MLSPASPPSISTKRSFSTGKKTPKTLCCKVTQFNVLRSRKSCSATDCSRDDSFTSLLFYFKCVMWRIRGLWEKGWGTRMQIPKPNAERRACHFMVTLEVFAYQTGFSIQQQERQCPPDVSDLSQHIFPFLSFLCCFMLFITDLHPPILLSLGFR